MTAKRDSKAQGVSSNQKQLDEFKAKMDVMQTKFNENLNEISLANDGASYGLSKTSKYSSILGKMSGGLGRLGGYIAAYSIMSDLSNPDISGGRLAYNTGSTLTSVGIGSAYGTGWGLVAGASLYLGDKLNSYYAPIREYNYNQFSNQWNSTNFFTPSSFYYGLGGR